jgi:hypothetical protein
VLTALYAAGILSTNNSIKGGIHEKDEYGDRYNAPYGIFLYTVWDHIKVFRIESSGADSLSNNQLFHGSQYMLPGGSDRLFI